MPLVSVEHLAPTVRTERRDPTERKVCPVLPVRLVARVPVGPRDPVELECPVLPAALAAAVFLVSRDLLVAVVPLVPTVCKELLESLALMARMAKTALMANLVLMASLVLMARRVLRETAANLSCRST